MTLRFLFASVLAVLLVGGAVAAAVVLVSGGEGGPDGPPAPADCVEAWNRDITATDFGTHNYGSHGYRFADVERRELAPNDPPGGRCTVIFGAQALDPEPLYAGEVYRAGVWWGLKTVDGLDLGDLARLQSEADARRNVALQPDGTLKPL